MTAGTTLTRITTIAAATAAAATAGAAVAVAASSDNHVAAQSPAAILRTAVHALDGATSYKVVGTSRASGRTTDISFSFSGTAVSAVIRMGGAREQLRKIGSEVYLNANRAYWQTKAPSQASALAGKWFELSASALGDVTGDLSPHVLASCLVSGSGTLSSGGRRTVDGQRVVIVRSAGNRPGTRAGSVAVATTGTPYPVQLTQTGKSRPGGSTACASSTASTDVANFSDFNAVPAITAPAGATPIPTSKSARASLTRRSRGN